MEAVEFSMANRFPRHNRPVAGHNYGLNTAYVYRENFMKETLLSFDKPAILLSEEFYKLSRSFEDELNQNDFYLQQRDESLIKEVNNIDNDDI